MPLSTRVSITMRTIKGFTLIELVIVMVITGIVVVIAASIFSSAFTNYFTAANATALSNQATIAMARMSKELQQANSFTAATATSMTFTTTTGSTIAYSWSSPVITRTGSTAQTLSNQVTSFSLSYYQANFSTTATLNLVRAVTISMTLSNGQESVPMINTIFLSNMK